MRFTDIFIRRPVLASVISLLIAVIGLMAFRQLPLRQFPEVNLSNISITARFPGATAEAMQGMVTSYIQDAVASVDGIDYISSYSGNGYSQVTVRLQPGTNVDTAITAISTKVQETKSNLPTDPSFENPIVQKSNADSGGGLMYIAFYSSKMSTEQISDYISRVVAKKLQTIDGVAGAGSLGGRTYAMRIWLDPTLMAAKNVTIPEIQTALKDNNVMGSAGYIEGKNDLISIEAETGLANAQEFNNVVVRKGSDGHTLVRIKDIGYAELGASSYNNSVLANGKPAVVLKITTKADANPLTVAKNIKHVLPEIESQLPASMHAEIVFDQSRFIQESVHTVIETIIEASIIVIIVIFLCLGSLRAVLIPMITIPTIISGCLCSDVGVELFIQYFNIVSVSAFDWLSGR